MNDVFADGRRHFVVVQSKAPKNGLRWIFSILALVAVLIGPLSQIQITRANSSYFYPQSCVGGWRNPERATGVPEVAVGESADFVNEEHSAYIENASAELICESFGGEVPPYRAPSNLFLRMSWRMDLKEAPITDASESPSKDEIVKEEGEAVVADEAATVIFGEDLRDVAQEILDAPADKPVILDIPNEKIDDPAPPREESSGGESTFPTSEESAAKGDSTEDSSRQDPPSIVSPETSAPIDPVPAADPPSLIESAAPTTPSPSSEPSAWLQSLVSVAKAETLDPHSTNSSLSSFLEILYTTGDGSWQRIALVGMDNWRGLRATIPIESWMDLAHLRISVRALPSFTEQPRILIDGMQVMAQYAEEESQLSLMDLFRGRLVNQKQQGEKQFAIVQKDDGQRELWFTPILWSKITASESIGADTLIETHQENVFWFDAQKRTLSQFNSASGGYSSVSMNEEDQRVVLPFSDTAGERWEAVYSKSDGTITFTPPEVIKEREDALHVLLENLENISVTEPVSP